MPNWIFAFGIPSLPVFPTTPPAILHDYEEWHVGYPSGVYSPGQHIKGILIEVTGNLLERTDAYLRDKCGNDFRRIPVTVNTLPTGFPIRAWMYQHIGHAQSHEHPGLDVVEINAAMEDAVDA